MSSHLQLAPGPVRESQLATAYSVCRSVTRRAAKNFYYGFLVLPRHKRQALSAVYAFMRHCDDISDDPGLNVSERRQRLAAWLQDLHRALSGEVSDDAVLIALADTVQKFKIPVGLLEQLANGTGMDLEETSECASGIRYQTFDDLYLYCYRVASVVGLICIQIFGYRDPFAEELAERCGVAFQLTNIIRDVKEDAAMGRVYLPEDDLLRFGRSAAELSNGFDPVRFRPVLQMEADRAYEFYRAADQLLPLIDEDSQPALWVLVTIYRRLLDKIVRRKYNVFRGRIRLTTGEKLGILARGYLRRVFP
jgi:phytoene synthase